MVDQRATATGGMAGAQFELEEDDGQAPHIARQGQAYVLDEVDPSAVTFARITHGLGTARRWPRLVARAAEVGLEVASALPRDMARIIGRRRSSIIDVVPGHKPASGRRVALYVHYCATGRISPVVRRQVADYAAAGFEVVFITMSSRLSLADWLAIAGSCSFLVRRENFGRDFGAWRDVVEEVIGDYSCIDELLLANDSVIGPIRPLAPVLLALRQGGEGVFGLTESIQGGPHLQSYFLIVRGAAAVADLAAFLRSLVISHSKWLIVQRGELRLTHHMRGRGHRVQALFGYRRLVTAVAADRLERARLARLDERFARAAELVDEDFVAMLIGQPLNPTHHFWAALVRLQRFPFFKAELLLRNPGRLPGVQAWAELVPEESPCPPSMLREDIAIRTAGASDGAMVATSDD